MAFDLERIRSEARAAPLPSPYPPELSTAVINDTFRTGRLVPLPTTEWKALRTRSRNPLLTEQMGMLAHFLAVTSLRAETVRALPPRLDAKAMIEAFFESVAPLTAEMIRANAFRQEEFLRKWIDGVAGEVTGETPKDSKKRLEQLDYRKTLAEYDRAEKARRKEASHRAKLLKEAAEREAAARGWRE